MTMLVIFYLSNLEGRLKQRPSGTTGGICHCILAWKARKRSAYDTSPAQSADT